MIDKAKKYKTRSGLEVEIYRNKGVLGQDGIIAGGVKHKKSWSIEYWLENGSYDLSGNNTPQPLDIIDIYDPLYEIIENSNAPYLVTLAKEIKKLKDKL